MAAGWLRTYSRNHALAPALPLPPMTPRWNNLPGNLRGAVLMSLAAMLFAGEALAIRYMNERGIPTAMQLFARSFGQLLWVMPLLLQSGLAVFRTNRRGLHILRGTASLLTWGFYYLSFAFLDLATATVLSFTNVMFTTLLAGPVLKERIGAARWAGTMAGFLGVVLMLRPGAEISLIGVVLALASAASWCGITLTSRMLAQTERNETVLAWVGLVTSLGMLPFAVSAFTPIGAFDLLFLFAFAITTPGIIWLLTSAYRAGEASAVAPFQYLRLLPVVGFGWIFFGEVPDPWTWLGGGIILSGALLITIAETRRKN